MGGRAATTRERLLVLLVDDSRDNRTMYAEYLAFCGFDVLEADNGVQAVATARAERPDAIIMDVGLPAIDGIEATRMLRAEPATKNTIVLALSGHGDDMEESATRAGVDRYLRKPCLPTVLVDHLRALFRERGKLSAR
jgi:two-component system, cell cycle response regulator DivK